MAYPRVSARLLVTFDDGRSFVAHWRPVGGRPLGDWSLVLPPTGTTIDVPARAGDSWMATTVVKPVAEAGETITTLADYVSGFTEALKARVHGHVGIDADAWAAAVAPAYWHAARTVPVTRLVERELLMLVEAV